MGTTQWLSSVDGEIARQSKSESRPRDRANHLSILALTHHHSPCHPYTCSLLQLQSHTPSPFTPSPSPRQQRRPIEQQMQTQQTSHPDHVQEVTTWRERIFSGAAAQASGSMAAHGTAQRPRPRPQMHEDAQCNLWGWQKDQRLPENSCT